MRIAVVVLAGGEGTRIGGGKPLRLLGDRPLIDHALGLALQWSDDVAVAVRDKAQLGSVDVPFLPDSEGDGPIAGIASALRFAHEGGMDAVLTIPCDEPFLPPDLPWRLEEALTQPVAIPFSDGRLHPASALWSSSALSALPAYLATGRRSLLGFAEAVGYATVEWPATPHDPFFNINSAADLAAAEALLRNR